jgi:hypothetical protein
MDFCYDSERSNLVITAPYILPCERLGPIL